MRSRNHQSLEQSSIDENDPVTHLSQKVLTIVETLKGGLDGKFVVAEGAKAT